MNPLTYLHELMGSVTKQISISPYIAITMYLTFVGTIIIGCGAIPQLILAFKYKKFVNTNVMVSIILIVCFALFGSYGVGVTISGDKMSLLGQTTSADWWHQLARIDMVAGTKSSLVVPLPDGLYKVMSDEEFQHFLTNQSFNSFEQIKSFVLTHTATKNWSDVRLTVVQLNMILSKSTTWLTEIQNNIGTQDNIYNYIGDQIVNWSKPLVFNFYYEGISIAIGQYIGLVTSIIPLIVKYVWILKARRLGITPDEFEDLKTKSAMNHFHEAFITAYDEYSMHRHRK